MITVMAYHTTLKELKHSITKLAGKKQLVSLLACTKKKLTRRAPAIQLYSPSFLFRSSLVISDYLESWPYILSAKHGLVHPNQELTPYDETLRNKPRSARLQWSSTVLEQLKTEFDLEKTFFLFFTGKAYHEDLIPEIPHGALFFPHGMGIGKRIQYLSILVKTNKPAENSSQPLTTILPVHVP